MLRHYEAPTSAKQLVLLCEYTATEVLLTVHGDGYIHRAGLAAYAEVTGNQYLYRSGPVPLADGPDHELLGECIQHRLLIVRPMPDALTAEQAKCHNAIVALPNVIGLPWEVIWKHCGMRKGTQN